MIAALLPTGAGSRPFQDSFVLDFLVLFFLKKTHKKNFPFISLNFLSCRYVTLQLP